MTKAPQTLAFFHNHPLPTWLVDRKSLQIVSANKAAVKTFGFTPTEWKKKQADSFFNSDLKKTFTSSVKSKSGKTFMITGYCAELTVDRKKFISVSVHEEKKKSPSTYLALQKFQKAILSSSIVTLTNRQGDIIFVNKNFSDISGYTEEEAIGQNHRILNSGYHPKSFWSTMYKMISSGKTWRGEVRNKAKDGTYYWVDAFIMPFLDEKGEVREYLSIRNLITAKKKAEESLLQVNERLSTAMNLAGLGSAEMNIDTFEVTVSPEMLHLLGDEAGSAKQMHLEEFINTYVAEEDRELAWQKVDEGLALHKIKERGEVSLQLKTLARNGEVKLMEVRGLFMADNALGIFLDITEQKKTEQELSRLALIARHTNNAVIITDAYGKITWVNEGFERTTGYSLSEALGKSPGSLLQGPETDQEVIHNMREAIQTGKGFKVEVLNYTKSGKRYWVDVEVIPMLDEAGKVKGYIAIELDITQLKMAVSEMLKSQEQLQTIVNNIPMDVFMKDLRGRYTFYNRSFEKHFDGSHRNSGFTDFDLFEKHEAEEFVSSDKKILTTGETLTIEQDIAHDGKTDTYYTVKFPLKDINENIYGIAGVALPITERKQMEKALRESEERMRIAQEAANIGTWEWDLAQDRIYWHSGEASIRYFHGEKDAITFQEFIDLIHEDDRENINQRVKEVFNSDKKYTAEFRIKKDEEYRWLLASAIVIRDQENKPARFIGISMDITNRKLDEEKIRHSHELLQELNTRMLLATEAAHLGIWEYNIADHKVVWNDKMYEIFGVNKDQHNGSVDSWMKVLHPDDREIARAEIESALADGKDYHQEYRVIHANGDLRYVISYGKVQSTAKGKPIKMIGVIWDNTEQKRFEAQLRESEARYRSIVDHQLQMICRYQRDGTLTFVNRAYEETFGAEHGTLVGKKFIDFVPPANRERINHYVKELFDGKIETKPMEHLALAKDGWRWQEWFDLPLRNENGEIFEVQSIGHDISQRKQLEAEQARLDKIVRESYNEIYLFNYNTLTFEFANASALKNLGYTTEELRNLRLPDIFTYPDEMAVQALLNSLRNGDADRLQLQLKHKRKDGSRYDVDVLIQIMERDRSFVAIVSDITSKLVTEKKLMDTIHEKETLIKEIHHRVKNNLQLISSIIYLKMASLSHSDIRTFLENTRQKIRSIALIHERLIQSEKLDRVEISDYLGKLIHDIQITYFRQDLDLQITSNIQEKVISLDTAIICGLIVNELVTNAIKHAFTGRASGTLEIGFSHDDSTGKFLLKIADNGVSLPANITPGTANSFGMQLLDVFVKQLGGTFEIIREKGTIFLIRF